METWRISGEFPILVHHESSKHNRKPEKVFICQWICVLQKNDIWESGRQHKLLPCLIWTTAFMTVTRWTTAAATNVCFPLKSNNDHPWQTVPPSCSHAHMSPHNLFLILQPSLLWIAVSVWVHPPSVIAPLCHRIPPRPVPDSDEHWRGGRNESTRLKYGSNYKQKDVRKGWPM